MWHVSILRENICKAKGNYTESCLTSKAGARDHFHSFFVVKKGVIWENCSTFPFHSALNLVEKYKNAKREKKFMIGNLCTTS